MCFFCWQWRNISRWWWFTPAGEKLPFCGWKWQSRDASTRQPDLGPWRLWPHWQNPSTRHVSKIIPLSLQFVTRTFQLWMKPCVCSAILQWLSHKRNADIWWAHQHGELHVSEVHCARGTTHQRFRLQAQQLLAELPQQQRHWHHLWPCTCESVSVRRPITLECRVVLLEMGLGQQTFTWTLRHFYQTLDFFKIQTSQHSANTVITR